MIMAIFSRVAPAINTEVFNPLKLIWITVNLQSIQKSSQFPLTNGLMREMVLLQCNLANVTNLRRRRGGLLDQVIRDAGV